jgi:hypothetical protein
MLAAAGPARAADSQKLFDVDVNKQKAGLEKDFAQADQYLNQTKLQNARSQGELLAHKLKQMKNDLTKDEAASYQTRIDNVTTRIGAKEDSLIKVTMDILHTKGVDPALAYLQNDLRMIGVSEKKTGPAEKTILEEAPKIQQSLEHQAIERALKALQSGTPLDPDVDPYIVKTAERIIKAHTDSIAAVENAKARKELEEKQRVERIQKEKDDKEKKLEDEKAAKIKQEEDKKKLAQQEIDRKKSEAEEKEKQRLALIEQERQKKLAVQAEKARKDSLAAAMKDSIATAQKLAVQQAENDKKEKARQAKLSVQQKEQERAARVEEDRRKQELAKQEKARQDSLGAAQKDSAAAAQKLAVQQAQQEKQRQSNMTQQEKGRQPAAAVQKSQGAVQEAPPAEVALPPKEPAVDNSAAAARKLQQQEAAAREQQRKLEAQQKEQERLAKIEEDRKKLELAQREKIRQDSLMRLQARVAAARKAEPPPQEKPPEISKEAQSYLQGLKDNRKKAQDDVMTLYDMVDKKRSREALEKFKQDRAFIAQFVDAQVFNVLEQTIAQSAISSQPETAVASPAKPAAAVAPEQEEIDKINNLMRDNKIESAYAELKRTESSLKHFMTRQDFKLLKNEVESAYKIRKQGGTSK